MVINWSEFAIENLRDFIKITKIYNIAEYTNELFEYTDNLKDNNSLGKYILIFNSYEIRQLVFKKHKILYYIYDNEIRILALIHSSQDYGSILKQMLKYM